MVSTKTVCTYKLNYDIIYFCANLLIYCTTGDNNGSLDG